MHKSTHTIKPAILTIPMDLRHVFKAIKLLLTLKAETKKHIIALRMCIMLADALQATVLIAVICFEMEIDMG